MSSLLLLNDQKSNEQHRHIYWRGTRRGTAKVCFYYFLLVVLLLKIAKLPFRFGKKKELMGKAVKVLTSRAVQCSFSSAFHLGQAGLSANSFNLVKQTVTNCVIIPGLIFGSTSLAVYLYKN